MEMVGRRSFSQHSDNGARHALNLQTPPRNWVRMNRVLGMKPNLTVAAEKRLQRYFVVDESCDHVAVLWLDAAFD